MKRLPPQQVEGMTIFGVGIASGLFGLYLLENAPTSFSPTLLYILGPILIILGFVYFVLSVLHSRAKE